MFHYRVREDNLAWNAEKKCSRVAQRQGSIKSVNHELGPIDVSARTEGVIWSYCQVIYKGNYPGY